MRTFTRALPAATAALVLAVGLSGCGASAANDADVLRVVTTTTQLQDFALEVTADTDAEVTSLFQPGGSVHSFEPTAGDLETIRQADVVVINGMGLEPWIEDTLASAGFDGELVDASEGVTPLTSEDEHEEHSEDDGHDHSEGNPHIWTSPENAEIMVQNVAEGLSAANSEAADTITANAEAYEAKLAELDEWIASNIEQVPVDDRLLATNHDALTYYNLAYDITFVGSVMPSWEDNAEPSVAEVNALVEKIKATGVPAVFTESQLKPTTAEAIAEQAGVKVYSGENALYTDSLGPTDSPAATYLAATIHNTKQILDSWGATPSELPASLAEAE